MRQNLRINGITIGGFDFKLSQYADDTCLYLSDANSLKTASFVFELFRQCSGLKIHMEKSEAIWIGASSNYRHTPYGLKWTQGAKCLGIYMSNDINKISEMNFKERFQKIEDLLKLRTFRKLTLKGKVLIINTLIMQQLLYACSVLYMPKNI